jgi:cysteine-rich repeat protein
VQGVEECDDGNNNQFDGCSPGCTWEVRVAFVTSTMYTGNVGGIVGADAICNMHAQQANLPGTYMAWISTNLAGQNPATRFTQSAVPYYMPNFMKIADNWADLTDGTLDNAISVDQNGNASPVTTDNSCGSTRIARTGTAANGTAPVGLGRCNNFTSSSNGGQGTPGVTVNVDATWTNCAQAGPVCSILMPIYCFQQ